MRRSHQLPAALPSDLPIQELMRQLVEDQQRTDRIVAKALAAWQEGRNVLLLSERTNRAIAAALEPLVPDVFVLHGRLGQRQRSATLAALEALPPDTPRIVVATGRLVGEGFDHPSLDTLLLAMPVSWKGTLQQYAGRLHRLARSRPSDPAAHVGAKAAGLQDDGLRAANVTRSVRPPRALVDAAPTPA